MRQPIRKKLGHIKGPHLVEGFLFQGHAALVVIHGCEVVIAAPDLDELHRIWAFLPGSAEGSLNEEMVRTVSIGSADKTKKV